MNTFIQVITISLLASATVARADSAQPSTPLPPPSIEHKLRLISPPQPDLANKKIYVEFRNSKSGAALIRARLDRAGFQTVDAQADADLTLSMGGRFEVSGAGKKPARGSLGEFIDNALPEGAVDSPDYRHGNINILQMAVSTIPLGGISYSQVATWLAQQTGLAGLTNEAMTGDPRGICVGESCPQRKNYADFNLTMKPYGHWWISSEATDQRVVIDLVVSDAIERGLQPLLDLRRDQPSENNTTKQVIAN